MITIKTTVHNGRIDVPAPSDIPDGTEVRLIIAASDENYYLPNVAGQWELTCSPLRTTGSEAFPKFILRPMPTADEVEHLLDQLSAGPPGKVLPADFSRADIYDDHD